MNLEKELSSKGICIISGLAMGIDGIAHNVAIEEQGKNNRRFRMWT